MPAKRFIQSAIKKPGVLRSLASREGALTKSGTIKVAWLRSKAKEKGHVGQRARLAVTLRKLKHK